MIEAGAVLNEQMASGANQTYILNPNAGRRGRRQRNRLIERLHRAAPEAEILQTTRRGEAEILARARCDDPTRVVIAVGGDGTVHEVGSALVGAAAALGVLPTGSGNDFASMVRVPEDMDRAAEFFASQPIRRCDAGRVEWVNADGSRGTAAFINGLGLGFEGAVAARAETLSRVPGLLRYLLAVASELPGYRSAQMTLGCESDHWDARQFLVAVGNGRRAGGGFLLNPEAVIDDGWLDLCRADDLPLHRLLRILPRVFTGGHLGCEGVHAGRCRRLHVTSVPPTPVHADGEVLTRDAVELTVSIAAASLRLVG